MANFQPGDFEAMGAVQGMNETYGAPPIEGMRIGQRATYRPTRNSETATAGEIISGIVVRRDDGDETYHIAEHVPGNGRRVHIAKQGEVSPF